jgi:hypothetical protein
VGLLLHKNGSDTLRAASMSSSEVYRSSSGRLRH